jgi:PKHD-type hydroxylase
MNLENYYYSFEGVLPRKLCEDIIEYGKQQIPEQATTHLIQQDGSTNEDGSVKESVLKKSHVKRKSDIVWMNERWIYKEIHPFVHEANKNSGWNFDWDISEHCQFTRYGPGQYYGWHSDSVPRPYNEPNNSDTHGKIRKLSMTISLSHPEEYEGGNLEFDLRNQYDWELNKDKSIVKCTEIRPRGSVVVFPSFVWHRVTPVTRGTRYSLVVWSLGQPFR